ncbi:hypothetical protein DL766_010025 [Monosporascus sp. MC13-8B]|nr:hypothetical protein DL766_010025 [Monosporascus sp. MC13-8B]
MTTARHCISAEVHDRVPGREHLKIPDADLDPRRVPNHVIHYFGCLEFQTYFRKLGACQQDLIRDQLRRVNRLKSFVKENCFGKWRDDSKGVNVRTWDAVQKHRLSRRKHCPPNCNVDFDPIDEHGNENGSETSNGAEGVTPSQPSSQSSSSHTTQINGQQNSDQPRYNPDNDVKGYLIQYKMHNPNPNPNDISNVFYIGEDLIEPGREQGQGLDPEQQRTAIWKGKFPGQKAIVYDLLQRPVDENSEPGKQYLSRDFQRGDALLLRYFHFPANNMKDAIPRYYDEKDVQFNNEETNKRDQDAEWEATEQRRKEMKDLLNEIGIDVDDIGPPKREGTFRNIDNIDTFPDAVVAKSPKLDFLFPKRRKVTRDMFGRLRLKNSLAQLLSVKTTRSRDRDQVVYRETTPKEDSLHSWDYGKNGKVIWDCNGPDSIPKRRLADINNMDLYARKYTKLKTRCPKCASAKRHRLDWKRQPTCPREDENTSNESDDELEDESTSNESDKGTKGKTGCKLCGSAALMCQQPRVLDIFSEAIVRVTHKQTLAFDYLWESAKKLCHASSAPSSADLSNLLIPLLNIAPEGMLGREIKDILDELSIMIHLVEQQRDVLGKFVENATTIICEARGTELELSKKKKWFETSAQALLSDVDGHLLELITLKRSATSTSEGLLTLKQQQASLIQAWQ